MSRPRRADIAMLGVAAFFVLGAIGCVAGAAIDPPGFFRAWLCAYLFWLGLPLCGVTLVLVHDLSGGEWMATARPALDAAIATMPLATLAGIPAFIGLPSLYAWTHPSASLGNVFYLNPPAFLVRYAVYVVLWNLLAVYALWGPRGEAEPIAPGLSWLSGIGLILLAFSASFAAIDWILSLEPEFWSSIFPMTAGAGWFNTGMAVVVLTAAISVPAADRRSHLADLAQILLATTIFWAYVEFVQFLIIWEEDISGEIAWYLRRFHSVWQPAMYVAIVLGFFVPFLVLLWAPAKRSRLFVSLVCVLTLFGHLAGKWWLVLPEFSGPHPFWLDVAAVAALGGLIVLLFLAVLRFGLAPARRGGRAWNADHV